MISTRNLSELPTPSKLHAAMQSMALLDAIIMPEWEYRFYSFEDRISPDGSISIGSMRNGSGDDFHAIFGRTGCLIRGFAHEYPMSPYAETPPRVYPGVIDDVPVDFAECRSAMASDWWHDITFCIWRRHEDSQWQHGNIKFPLDRDADGSEFLLSMLDGKPETYRAWAEVYYSLTKLDLTVIRKVFKHEPLTDNLVRQLNPERSLHQLGEEIKQIGYGPSS